MVKKWYDIEKIIDREIEIPKKLYKYQEIMEEVPNFDKRAEENIKRKKTRNKNK